MVVTALREHRKRQDDERADAGDRWTDSRFVFPTKLGGPMSPYALTKYWHSVRAKAGVATLRFHDLRHTAVSLLLALGEPPHVVREIAGHSDITETDNAQSRPCSRSDQRKRRDLNPRTLAGLSLSRSATGRSLLPAEDHCAGH